MIQEKINPQHITQAYSLSIDEKDLDFFDANLFYDTALFIDPFLLKTSSVKEENELFKRFGMFFKHVYDLSLRAKEERDINKMYNLLSFSEPKETCLGYTRNSHQGSGPSRSFAKALTDFFLKSSIKRVIVSDESYPDGQFNPDILTLVSKDMGPDGISDMTTHLIMDYLITYTQEQCKKLNIETKSLPLSQIFDYEEMNWTNGRYVMLPENLIKPGIPIIFVPKRLLRMDCEMNFNKAKSKLVGILKDDNQLSERFAGMLSKNINEISLEELNQAIFSDNTIVKKYLKTLEAEGIKSYDFEIDVMNFLAIKRYALFFDENRHASQDLSCAKIAQMTEDLTNIFNEHCSTQWKHFWRKDFRGNSIGCKEEAFGMVFLGMGTAYFSHEPDITFIQEAESGNGPVDFLVIYKDCKITIELKKLSNNQPTGKPPIPAYLHGIQRQLPEYTKHLRAKYAFYITGQHRKESSGKKPKNDDKRELEIRTCLPNCEKEIRNLVPAFVKLYYVNVDLSPKASASKK